jgi:SPX domain protein involved in polyphosphate accumulation
LQGYLEPFVELDPFAARRPSGRYEISSIYLDTDRFRLCDETLGGQRDRYKLRIRAYTDRPDDPVFFEVKTRRDRKIAKQRARVRRADMFKLFQTGELSTANMSSREVGFYDAFVAKMRWIDAHPKVIVRYEREAYHGKYDDEVRVTFDRQIRGMAVGELAPFFAEGMWNHVESRRVVVELKFNGKYPPWLAAAIRLFRLERISYSKYANSVEASYRRGSTL